MSVDITWPRTTGVGDEERLLRKIFEYVGIDLDKADNATLIGMVEQHSRKRGNMWEAVALLQEEADRLERWAVESEKGGWSTHQVQPMRERASAIRAKLIGWGF